MVDRKTYDHWGIEISIWNKSNIVTFVDCDCGQLAKRELGKHNQFKCDRCKKEYKLRQGNYVLIDGKSETVD
ncbi:hypothetical protein D5663_14490 [Enterococcus faecalis]|uniref:hypothetical protein n=1 Tax=Enterococcus faecalis TaxID=1351 RepID=UPI00032EC8D6|nr:hypothetical protein [Enterococcus faecalis]MCA8631514.1 hypothetical protein [Escherichia coli]EGO2662607.1 hypothetical protein [Enterococcus faecalis]EGO8429463.1 hypothetical protein [Enterococcus faecalis]EGO8831134.1 hypothetical protein [Enterococcus faecalis]EGO9353219.1 hypothetical protein [Enterococcus faecalis]